MNIKKLVLLVVLSFCSGCGFIGTHIQLYEPSNPPEREYEELGLVSAVYEDGIWERRETRPHLLRSRCELYFPVQFKLMGNARLLYNPDAVVDVICKVRFQRRGRYKRQVYRIEGTAVRFEGSKRSSPRTIVVHHR
jgi:hypothetical protein